MELTLQILAVLFILMPILIWTTEFLTHGRQDANEMVKWFYLSWIPGAVKSPKTFFKFCKKRWDQ